MLILGLLLPLSVSLTASEAFSVEEYPYSFGIFNTKLVYQLYSRLALSSLPLRFLPLRVLPPTCSFFRLQHRSYWSYSPPLQLLVVLHRMKGKTSATTTAIEAGNCGTSRTRHTKWATARAVKPTQCDENDGVYGGSVDGGEIDDS
ncbi:hypothetical protein BU26DRAFT_114834 [Trematosphaeria pertusa]|uniref:Secreted protein n=1 Tax=Trematosphaeria pertusa TaxID=390896 RepID=A0A6A6HYI3_9PLEO|nr:uncharacterized protein BU26DRAFT_114834 [Trematosphaeria pertusa]KAF2243275.1 hypothetical protein BU26DRAFT_114834 [Trematosphaeria pertusa]